VTYCTVTLLITLSDVWMSPQLLEKLTSARPMPRQIQHVMMSLKTVIRLMRELSTITFDRIRTALEVIRCHVHSV